MPKHRLGVALLIPEPAAIEIDGLRRALGDPALGRMPAHLTLVPPVNVRADRMADALAVLRAAAAATSGPLSLTLGPIQTFLPVNPVLYLEVDGDVDELGALRDRVFRPPLERSLSWPFVPHVTVADDADVDRIESALVALSSYERAVTIDRVHLLEEGPGRSWAPIADAAFARPAVVGRGGLPVELSVTRQADPEARTALASDRIVVTARRDGEVLGLLEGTTDDEIVTLFVRPENRGEGISRHLVAQFRSALAERD